MIQEATDAATKAKDAIDKAKTNNDVATEQTKGTNAIEAVKVPSLTDSQTAAKDAVDAAVTKQKALITNANNLSDNEKQDLNNQVDAAAKTAKDAITAATTNDGAVKAGQDGVAAIEQAVPTSLEDAKKAATKVVEDAVDQQKALITKANNLSDKEKQALNNQVDEAAKTAKDAITAAKTNDVATKAGQDGKTAIEAVTVPTDSDVKKNAKNAIDQAAKTKDAAIDASNLTAEEKDALKKKVAEEVNKAKGNIDAATKDADVNTAQTTGEKAINAVEIPASVSKTDAIKVINAALTDKKAEINGTNLTAEEKTAVINKAQKLADAAIADINKATTNDAVNTAKENGVQAIKNMTIPTVSDVKKNAKNAIDQAAKTKDDAIDASNLTAEEKDALKKTVAGEVQTAKDNIDDATKDADVTTAQTNGEKAINAVEIPASVSKTAAINAINTALAAKKGAINGKIGRAHV